MSSRTLTPQLAAAVERAKAEARASGELRKGPGEIPPSPLTAAQRQVIIDWHRSGDYDRIVADLVTHDPDLATQ